LELLCERKQLGVHGKDRRKATPLHVACELGRLECVKILMRAGASADAKDKISETPLHKAARGGFAYIVERLCEAKYAAAQRDATLRVLSMCLHAEVKGSRLTKGTRNVRRLCLWPLLPAIEIA
jgi:ankyrin repeat protein